MTVDEVLTLDTGELAPLTSPVLVIGLTGWFDVAGAATAALAELTDGALTVGEIDADPFYDFTQERPTVELVDGETRQVSWPANDFQVVRTGGAHDLVVLSGVEPHLAWPLYIACSRRIVERLRCEAVVTLGATADAIPHTRMPPVVGSTADPELARRLALSAPTYQGITGLIGALHVDMEQAGVPTISLRVGVPHYLGNAQHPQSSIALLQHLHHVLGVPVHTDRLAVDAQRRRVLHDEAVAEDEQATAYVAMLEREYDQKAEAAIPSGEDLAADFERFLRDQRDDEG